MRKLGILLSILVLAAMVLAACGGEATSTNVVESPPAVTADATEAMTATESPTEEGTATATAGVPVTGDLNPARLSNQLDFTVWSQDGEQIGDVNDMVLDLDNSQVAYVVVGTGGFLDLGEREILVPWESLQLQTGAGDTTGGQQNAFILQTDLDVFRNAPDFDLAANLPPMGESAADWDVDIRGYWQGGGAGTVEATSTPAAGATTSPDATATATSAGAGTGLATATTDASGGTGTGTGTGQVAALQGVVLATEVLGSTVNLGGIATGPGTGTEQATATPGTAPADSTATAAPAATAEATATGAAGTTTATIEDMITDIDTGEILFVVITTTLAEGERWVPVPLGMFQWDSASGAFMVNTAADMLQGAPFFPDGQFPDTTTSGWNTEFDTFWQNMGTGGTGTQSTPTP